jgi:hypothetical protein
MNEQNKISGCVCSGMLFCWLALLSRPSASLLQFIHLAES